MTGRDARIDNAKGVLIILVVLGHLVWPVPSGDRPADGLYFFAYLFHMPMFALISGWLSRVETGWAALVRNGRLLLAPYVIFVALHALILRLMGQEPYPFLQGLYGLWYLLSLFCWRMVLPYARRVPLALPLSVALALAAGFVPFIGLDLSLSRTLVLLPFFLAGHRLREKGVSPTAVFGRLTGGALVATGLLLAAWLSGYAFQPMLYGNGPYAALGPGVGVGFAARAVQLAAAFGLGLGALALTPGAESPLTRIGRHSLHVYLLHTLLLVPYRLWPGAYGVLGSRAWLLIPAAVLLAWLLASPPVVKVTRRLVAPLG
ncbi:acyltransferase 3 [Pseudodesulfovibrio mercurii]|uniref:Acyltransferase 3 n=1 Tax=Pseudodesulfovibrio mercurii TaxID=641491 RepID=F0JG26_9BACT|nr:acyltransferase family protein [Pseudodesulfovibrio mercurii]EGB15022.1 acyltransferase 3 [Pseudodesulfovibrio mercurii]